MSNSQVKKVTILAGDGIGPEVMQATLRVLRALAEIEGVFFSFQEELVGGAAIDAVGEPLPAATLAACRAADAVLFGSVGGPRWEQLPREQTPEIGGLLRLRKELDLFANLRPARVFRSLAGASPLHPDRVGEGFDYVVVRELTGDVYFGEPKFKTADEAGDTMRYTREEIERIARVAFRTAATRRGVVTSIDKANVLAVSQFWREVVSEVHAREFPEITLSHLYVDNAAMQLVLRPQQFDVVLTPNLFGDILSDEAGATTGSIGMLPSASLNADGFGLYEPSGGSAPDIAGQGIANPSAQILSAALMLRHSFGMAAAAARLEHAVEKTLEDGIRTGDIMAAGCTRVGTEDFASAVIARLD